MIIMVYSAFNAASIDAALGAPEYSYWFVRRAFWPALEKFGVVVPVTDPQREVDVIRASAAARGEDSAFFCFEPPHKTTLGLRCRTIPVFAWEFDTIPQEEWDDEPRNDWRTVLAATGSCITHSTFSADAVRRAMGPDYQVWSIPAPMYDSNVQYAAEARPYQPETVLPVTGIVIDSAQVDLGVFSFHRSFADGLDSLRALAAFLADEKVTTHLRVAGVVYTAVFNPIDGRKNFNDLLGGFIWAFRDVEDATLILKITHWDPVRGMMPVLGDLAKLGGFRCRVLLIHGMLPDEEYRGMMRLTSYTVNTSTNEGQCLPLMEFMSAGRPAVAPRHTSMLDYITGANAFVVPDTARLANWPHDPRELYKTQRYTVSQAALIGAYRESYRVAKEDPARYAAMSGAATEAMRAFCSAEMVERRLGEVLQAHIDIAAAPAAAALAED